MYIVKVRDGAYALVNEDSQSALCSPWIDMFFKFAYSDQYEEYREATQGEADRLLAVFQPWIEEGLQHPAYLRDLILYNRLE